MDPNQELDLQMLEDKQDKNICINEKQVLRIGPSKRRYLHFTVTILLSILAFVSCDSASTATASSKEALDVSKPVLPCKSVCLNDPTSWNQKCLWLLRCAGCSECAVLISVSLPSPHPSPAEVFGEIQSPQPSFVHEKKSSSSDGIPIFPSEAPSLKAGFNQVCQTTCATNPLSWRKKCDWGNICAGCDECSSDFQSEAPTPVPPRPCLAWCGTHEAFWARKCSWETQCSGCEECFTTSPSLSIVPSSSPTKLKQQEYNTTLFINIRANHHMDDNLQQIFEETTFEHLDNLSEQIATDNVQVRILDTYVDGQIPSISTSKNTKPLELLTEAQFLGMEVRTVIINPGTRVYRGRQDGNRRNLYSLRKLQEEEVENAEIPFVTVILVVNGVTELVPVSTDASLDDLNYEDRLFTIMEKGMDSYAIKLANSDPFFVDVIEQPFMGDLNVLDDDVSLGTLGTLESDPSSDSILPTESNGNGNVTTTLLIIAITVGALVGSLVIIICGIFFYFNNQRRNDKPDLMRGPGGNYSNMWRSSFMYNKRPPPISHENKIITLETSDISEPSVLTNPFPTSIQIRDDQESLSTVSNLGLVSKDSDSNLKSQENSSRNESDEQQIDTGVIVSSNNWETKMMAKEIHRSYPLSSATTAIESSISMPPPIDRKSSDDSNVTCLNTTSEADIISIVSSPDDKRNQKFLITVSVPPGSLGVDLESSTKGPRVQNIASDSPLVGLMEKGDIIVAVDNIDAQTMNPTLFSKHVLKINIHSQRVIKVIGSRPGATKRSELVSF